MNMRGYGVCIAAFFTVSIAYAVRYGYGMLLPGMLISLEITKTQAGVIYASYFLAYSIFSPLLGSLSDRLDSCLLLTFFSGLLAAGASMMAFVTTIHQAAFVFALAGIGHAACWAPVMSLVQQWSENKKRGTTLALVTMGSGIGIAAWSVLLPLIVERSKWQGGWLQLGIFGFIVAGLNFLLVRNPPGSQLDSGTSANSRDIRKSPEVSLFVLMKNTHLWLIGCSYMLIGFAVLVPLTFVGVYISEELHMSYSTATSFFTIIAVAGMGGKLILGALSDRWGRIHVMMICGSFLATGCWGIAGFEDVLVKIVFVAMIGVGFGAVWPVYAAASMDFFPKSVAGTVIGVWTFFLGIGSVLSPIICGWSIDFSGSYRWAFNIGSVAAIISVALLVPLLKVSTTLLGSNNCSIESNIPA